MKVELLQYTSEPDKTVAMAARLCYSARSIADLSEQMTDIEVKRMIQLLLKMGHLSPFEHAHFTIGIEGLSRVASHQLVRSRMASYSQQSQRYIEQRGFEYVTPRTIKRHPELEAQYRAHMDASIHLYEQLRDAGIPREDARFVLPGAAASNLIMSKNARGWLEWLEQRTCRRAQWEIRELAQRIMVLLQRVSPHLFAVAGPRCLTEGICPEGDYTCGRLLKRKVEDAL